MNRRTIRQAVPADLGDIMRVLDAAKGIMRSSGNLNQWINGYPSEEVVLNDMAKGWGHVVEDNGRITAYFAFMESPEPTYAKIFGGEWLDDTLPYHVIHRMGSYPEVHGIFSSIIRWCKSKDPNLRIDTHRDNHIMQHNILKHGFIYCGIIYLESGDERLAYQLQAQKSQGQP
ncbi:MAG: N-acetyltransferase [Bacteroidales bacterium]|nr:N-acetyltransferase [Bacteroidales bacterium]